MQRGGGQIYRYAIQWGNQGIKVVIVVVQQNEIYYGLLKAHIGCRVDKERGAFSIGKRLENYREHIHSFVYQ